MNYYGLSKEDYSAAFDASYYYNNYADLQAVYGYDEKALLDHFLNYGLAEGVSQARSLILHIIRRTIRIWLRYMAMI